MLVFVYGTLKSGHGNHRLLEGSEFVGYGKTAGHYHMLNGGFPRVVKGCLQEPRGHVTGELYEVDMATLARLDALEGHPTFYTRERVWVYDDSGNRRRAWTYLWPTGKCAGLGAFVQPRNGEVTWRR